MAGVEREPSPMVQLKMNQLRYVCGLSIGSGIPILGDSLKVENLINKAKYSLWSDLNDLGYGNEAFEILNVDPNKRTTINDILKDR